MRLRPEQVPDRRSPQYDTPPGRDTGPAERQTQADAQPAGRGGGGILDGLGDLLDNLAKSGQKDAADSWVKPDAQNQPIEPTDLGKAIGARTLSEIARQSGMSEEDSAEAAFQGAARRGRQADAGWPRAVELRSGGEFSVQPVVTKAAGTQGGLRS